MTYQALARKWRPQTLDDVLGQPAVTRTLRNALKSRRIAQAFVFAGPRGCGKTTTARILARALNCVEGPTPTPCGVCEACVEIAEGRDIDVLEIDAATHTQVDNVREVIIEGLSIAPARDRYKVFLIDEVHMLSNSSFNALLKSVEEPPQHVVFMMATTALEKIPDTILSRSQVHRFSTISSKIVADRLRFVADQEGISVPDDALLLLARAGEGSMRDSLSAFDQVRAFAGDAFTLDDVTSVLGLVGRDLVFDLLDSVAGEDAAAAFALVEAAISRGYDLRILCRELARAARDLLLVSVDPARFKDPDVVSEAERPRLTAVGAKYSREDLLRAFDAFTRAEQDVKQSDYPRFQLEMALVRVMHLRKLVPLGDLLDGGGRPAMAASRPASSPSRPSMPAARPQAAAARPAPAAPPPSRTSTAVDGASACRGVGASRRVGRRAGPLPGRGQGRQAVLLQRRRRAGLPHRGRGRAHHLRVPRQPEGAAGAVRGESRVAVGAGRAGPRPAGARARHRGDARVRGRGRHAGRTRRGGAPTGAKGPRQRRRAAPGGARRSRRAGAVRDLPGGTHQDRGGLVLPGPLDALIEQFRKLPGVGAKSAQRLAFHVLRTPREDAERLCDAIRDVKDSVTYCSVCHNITDVDPCRYCADDARDQRLICVVEEPQNVNVIEKSRGFRGVYHVLMGTISPLQGVGPDDLKIKALLGRIDGGRVDEVILATSPTVEGEATAIYLARLLRPLGVRVTRIATGIPVGSDLEYADELTMGKAMEGRRDVS